ncbi:MAG: Rv1355c family protein [Chitinophagales bacterium]|nr:Rv1355c family protein [Chitinophagales bacterium]
MSDNNQEVFKNSKEINTVYQPDFYRLTEQGAKQRLEALISSDKSITVIDELDGQLRELVKILNPKVKIKDDEYPALVEKHLAGRNPEEYGVWVYYPWSKKVIHLLDEEEFVEVRTNRNRYKLTKAEQEYLNTKAIGIIGLSVGQSIALTIAMERICGELRLADFDTVELSNLNRIRTGLHNLGLKKTILAAREILEIDPYLNVKVFNEGITDRNINEFFEGGRKLDLLVEVCDGLDIKIQSRFKARALKIPVVMDTNDRGMLDVERFDLEPDRPVMHGLAGDLNPEMIKDLTNEQKIPYILKMVGADTISTRLKASMMEVEQSINTWPQLASSVVLGGALTTDTARRILLDQFHDSGRYYIDFDELVSDKKKPDQKAPHFSNPFQPLELNEMKEIVSRLQLETIGYQPSDEELDKLVDAAIIAPSAGNNQPWKWLYTNGWLLLFHDKFRSWSWGDFAEMGAHMGLGTAIENVHLQAQLMGLKDNVQIFPLRGEPKLIAAIYFEKTGVQPGREDKLLAENIYTRCTNRMLGERKKLPFEFYQQIDYLVTGSSDVKLLHTDKEDDLDELGRIMAACDRIRMLHPQGHEEFYSEVRWNSKHAEMTRDGIELDAVDLTQGEKAAFRVGTDWSAISLLSEWGKGDAFRRYSQVTMKAASAALLFAIPGFEHEKLVNAGRAVQRVWIYANTQGVTVHPMLSPVFFFSRMVVGKGEELPGFAKEELAGLRESFLKIFPLLNKDEGEYSEVFLMKLAQTDKVGVRSLRRNKKDIFYRE